MAFIANNFNIFRHLSKEGLECQKIKISLKQLDLMVHEDYMKTGPDNEDITCPTVSVV